MISNVLLTCGGKWVGMVLQLKQVLSTMEALRGGNVLVADRAILTPAGCFADGSVVVPPIQDPTYIGRLLEICREHSVRVLIPLIDIDLLQLAPHLADFAVTGTYLVCPSPPLVELCFDKLQFEAFAWKHGLNPPRRYTAEQFDTAPYPLFYKRRRGFGSIGSGRCENPTEARAALRRDPDLIFQELIEAPEISVDCYLSRKGRSTVRVQRVRDKVVGGEVWQSHTIKNPEVADLAERTLKALAGLGLKGPLNIQLFGTNPPTLLEVNPRLGSGSVFSNFATGGRLLRSVLHEACGGTASGDPDDYREGLQLYRYLGDVFHDGAQPIQIFPPLVGDDHSRHPL